MEKKAKLKEELMKKIREEENERKLLENDVAKIEKDEMEILQKFKNINNEKISKKFDEELGKIKNYDRQQVFFFK
jgi:hypothetical protein